MHKIMGKNAQKLKVLSRCHTGKPKTKFSTQGYFRKNHALTIRVISLGAVLSNHRI